MIIDEIEVKQILNYPNYYISCDGKVYNKKTGRWLSLSLNKNTGYQYVCLSDKNNPNKNKISSVHRLVAETWLDDPEVNQLDGFDNRACVLHLDRNKTNNHYTNLKWSTLYDWKQSAKARYDEIIELRWRIFITTWMKQPWLKAYSKSKYLKAREWASKLGINMDSVEWTRQPPKVVEEMRELESLVKLKRRDALVNGIGFKKENMQLVKEFCNKWGLNHRAYNIMKKAHLK